MLKFGIITEIDINKGMARVKYHDEEIVSNLLPFNIPLTQDDKISFPIAINTEVWVMLDESGAYGIIGGSYFNAKRPMNGNNNKLILNINDGKLTVEVDRTSGNLNISTNGKVTIDSDLEVAGNVTVSGEVTATVDVKAGPVGAFVKLSTHVHPANGTPPTPTP